MTMMTHNGFKQSIRIYSTIKQIQKYSMIKQMKGKLSILANIIP